jgi:predicted nucleic acid-binding protein
MSRVFWDTNLFIYLFENYGDLSKQVVSMRERMLEREDHLFTSALTLGEILVKPLEKGDDELVRNYAEAIGATTTLLPFDRETAADYARIRKDRSIKAPDAIQLACAAHARIDLFITNDEHLRSKVIPGIQFIASLKGAWI